MRFRTACFPHTLDSRKKLTFVNNIWKMAKQNDHSHADYHDIYELSLDLLRVARLLLRFIALAEHIESSTDDDDLPCSVRVALHVCFRTAFELKTLKYGISAMERMLGNTEDGRCTYLKELQIEAWNYMDFYKIRALMSEREQHLLPYESIQASDRLLRQLQQSREAEGYPYNRRTSVFPLSG